MKNLKLVACSAFIGLFPVILASCQNGGDTGSHPINAVLTGIFVSKPATKLLYQLNEAVDYSGLEVKASWSTGRPSVVPFKDLTFTGFDSSTVGKKSITITYTYKEVTKSTSYVVSVVSSEDTGKDVKLDFYGFNDTHGNVLDSSAGAGITKVSTFIKQKSENQNSVLISSGDMWQGSLESNSNRGELMMRWMDSLNFASMTIGNHEFDWGQSIIERNASNFKTPILGINILDKDTKERVPYAKASTIIERGDARIGIIGAIGNCYNSISYSQVTDVTFALDTPTGEDELSKLVKAESTRLREEEDCDFIVFSLHGDTSDASTYYNVELSAQGYVDLVFEGHTHTETHYIDEGGVHHFQSSAGGSLSINHIQIDLNTGSDSYEVTFDERKDVYWLNSNSVYSLKEDETASSILNEYNYDEYYVPIGHNSKNRSSTEMRQLVASLYLNYGQRKWMEYANEIAFGGGFVSIRGEGYLPAGDVTYAQLNVLFPFDNNILLTKIYGNTMKSIYFNSTNKNYFMAYSEYGQQLKFYQDQVVDNELYYVVMDTYTFDYIYQNGHNPVKVDVYQEGGYYARDLLTDYIRDGGLA